MNESNLKFPENPFHMTRIGHSHVIDAVYNALPPEMKNNLKIDIMEDSSDDPDQKFKDMVKHHYPPSYKEATKWLTEGQTSYKAKDYDRASYCFGVASHYITDTFMAPHCVERESSKEHHNFEKKMESLTPNAVELKGSLDSLMKVGVEQGQKDWQAWLKTRDETILQSEADKAASASYTFIKNAIS
ncbi:zinc dependent phospholipase C family protein [uncultured Methanobacterium sp.]|uniref:zinc dependent phospholipase C family protein n=1 Tax=uncultured Methanobacterium sp. TaxID=176306 RepID=UPI002AA7CF7B|nr:zinc dependent phospholipase C family protein [uncultured Methanobacterium sp.]